MAIWNTQRRVFVHILARTNIGGNMVRIYAPSLYNISPTPSTLSDRVDSIADRRRAIALSHDNVVIERGLLRDNSSRIAAII